MPTIFHHRAICICNKQLHLPRLKAQKINETYAHLLPVTRIGAATQLFYHILQNLEIIILQKLTKKEHRFLDAPDIYNESTRFASNAVPRRYPCSQLGPGTLTSHERSCLVLLRSRPDTVHRFPLRKTQTSTPLTRGSSTNKRPQSNHHPYCSGL